MKNHVKIYFDYYNYTKADYIKCEVCNMQAVDIHHLKSRGMGGSKEKDNIENLIAVCRKCHEHCHKMNVFNKMAFDIHQKKLKKENNVK